MSGSKFEICSVELVAIKTVLKREEYRLVLFMCGDVLKNLSKFLNQFLQSNLSKTCGP